MHFNRKNKVVNQLLKQLTETYQNKTVLLTGHTGFKGAWLAIWLNELGANVIGYSLDPETKGSLFESAGLQEKMTDIRGDIRDFAKLKSVFEQYQPDIVFHLAAQSLVKYSYDYPVYTYDVNVMGTMYVLEAIRQTKSVKAGIFVTSDKCYENNEWIWGYRETDPLGGYDPYSSSKGCCELLISSYRHSFFPISDYQKHGVLLASVRAGNVIGGGDWSKDRIVPDCIRALRAKEPIVIRSPQAIRPWQHVLEPLSGYLLLGTKLYRGETNYAEAWNFGPEPESITTVEKLVHKIIHSWKSGSWELATAKPQVHEATLLSLDISKAKYHLNWHPKWRIEETVQKTIEWYQQYRTTDNYDLCVGQIKEYVKES